MSKEFTLENFTVADCNRFAVDNAKFVVDHLGKKNPLFLYGSESSGKTHLLKAIENSIDCSKYKVLYITCTDFINDVNNLSDDEICSKYDNLDVLLFDDFEKIERKNKIQRYLLKIFDNLYSNKKQIILCSEKSFDLLIIDERLRMRICWGIVAKLWDEKYEKPLEPIIAKGNELKELSRFLNVGKPILITPTMDYHKTLWGLTFTNSLLNDKKKVRYFSLHESRENMLEMIDKYRWKLKRDVLESSEAEGTFLEDKKDIDDIVKVINVDKPDVAIIDYFTSEELGSVKKIKYILTELTEVSKNNNTAIVIFGGGKPSEKEFKKVKLPDWFEGNENIEEDSDDDIEKIRDIFANGFYKIITIRPANMVEIRETGI